MNEKSDIQKHSNNSRKRRQLNGSRCADVTGNDTAGMSVDEHSNTLKTLDEVFEGNRLDYDNTAFKIRSGVDGVSKSVGNADIVYGKITYILDDVDGDILGIYDAKTGVLIQ